MFRLPHCERDFSLQPVGLIFAEALAEHLARVADDEEGIGIQLLDEALDHHGFLVMHRAQQQRAVFSRVAALAVQERHALVDTCC